MDIIKFLSGKKTYITAILLGIANTAAALHWATWDQIAIVNGILGPLGLAFLRMGVDAKGKTAPNA